MSVKAALTAATFSKLETTASASRIARRKPPNHQGEISDLDERLTQKPSSSRVSSQWKSRVKSRRKSTLSWHRTLPGQRATTAVFTSTHIAGQNPQSITWTVPD
jgi:hypothetical protein